MRPRDNPFASHRLLTLGYHWLDGSLEGSLEALVSQGLRGAVVGPHGSGKTTFLDHLVPHLQARGLVVRRWRLHQGERRLPQGEERFLARDLTPRDLLVVDGVNELAALHRWRLLRWSRGGAGLVVASHRPGLVPTFHLCRTTPQLLQRLVEELLGAAEVKPPGGSLPDVEELYRRHCGDLRQALSELYDLFARLEREAP